MAIRDVLYGLVPSPRKSEVPGGDAPQLSREVWGPAMPPKGRPSLQRGGLEPEMLGGIAARNAGGSQRDFGDPAQFLNAEYLSFIQI